MSQAIQEAIQDQLQTLADFAATPENVTLGDYRVLDSGGASAAIIEPGTFTSGQPANYQVRRQWDIPVNIFLRYSNDGEELENFTAFRDRVINLLDLHPTLGLAGVNILSIEGGSEPANIMDKLGGGPYFVMQTIRLTVIERKQLAGGEYV